MREYPVLALIWAIMPVLSRGCCKPNSFLRNLVFSAYGILFKMCFPYEISNLICYLYLYKSLYSYDTKKQY